MSSGISVSGSFDKAGTELATACLGVPVLTKAGLGDSWLIIICLGESWLTIAVYGVPLD